MNRSLRAGVVVTLVATSAVLFNGCTDEFVSAPQRFNGSVELRNWADTLVMGDRRMVAARVLDEQSREVLDRTLDWTVLNPSLLNLSVSTTRDGDSVRVTALLPGTTTVGVHFLDALFEEENQSQAVSVVLAGVEVTTADTVTLMAVADQGLLWTHQGSAVSLTAAGDTIRAVAVQNGVDTLVVTHPVCLAGAACADTMTVTAAIPVVPPVDPPIDPGTSIPADVKVLFIWTPGTEIPAADVNGLKQFAQEGGRVVVVGENQGYMGTEGLARVRVASSQVRVRQPRLNSARRPASPPPC